MSETRIAIQEHQFHFANGANWLLVFLDYVAAQEGYEADMVKDFTNVVIEACQHYQRTGEVTPPTTTKPIKLEPGSKVQFVHTQTVRMEPRLMPTADTADKEPKSGKLFKFGGDA
jgi:hypothetical protein